MISQWSYRIREVTDAADMEPLFDCPFLEHLTLWFNGGLDLDDQGIRRMGCAWTRLETVVLQADGFKTPPISCLVAFAESFPVLQRLESPFDRSGGLPPMNEITARFRCLRRLVIIGGWMYVDEMPSVAEFLARICGPDVRVYISDGTPPEREKIRNKGEDNEQTEAMRAWMHVFHRAQEHPGGSE
ncbi:hypothetical protein M407DRAFT_23975 [Tulasnella calospora MUT 4182]|uniref:Uncharacterized protein n=1 Tax=Tulasnella calospora MUT 4182 TaxID=1051891 RepID=A0A0C3Q9P4_9AGAM|nr:hypothetical protein M407DRAFT_23975 [Tulasnella calospora MUT 4182]